MLKGKKQSVIGLGAIVLLAAGCSAEPTVETAAETTPEAVTENAVLLPPLTVRLSVTRESQPAILVYAKVGVAEEV